MVFIAARFFGMKEAVLGTQTGCSDPACADSSLG